MTKLSTGAQALIALAVANILFVARWESIGAAISPYSSYFRAEPVSPAFLLSFFGSLLSVAAVLFVALFLGVRWNWLSEHNVYRIAGVCIVAWLLTFAPVIKYSRLRILLCALVIAACAMIWPRAAAVGRVLVTLAAVLFFIQAASFAWNYGHSPSAAELRDPSPVASPGQTTAQRIVWLLFDELDHELTGDLRPDSVEMPEFDRLTKETLAATDAHPPTDWTATAVPSFFIGDRVTEVYPRGPAALDLEIHHSRNRVSWGTRETLFTEARKQGLRSAIVGWHHPYCRIFGTLVDSCFWTPNVDATDSLRNDFALRQTGPQPVFPGWPLTSPGMQLALDTMEYDIVAAEHVRVYRQTKSRAVEVLRDTDLNFVFVHWLIPHPPGIYDRRRNQLGTAPGLNYLDNLELVDETIGSVRRTLEQAGLWDQTALIITGDHPLRTSLWSERPIWTREEEELCAARKDARVPLLIKVPGQKTRATYSAPMDALLIHDLISAWMAGRCGTVDEVRRLFDQRRERFPVHADGVYRAGVR